LICSLPAGSYVPKYEQYLIWVASKRIGYLLSYIILWYLMISKVNKCFVATLLFILCQIWVYHIMCIKRGIQWCWWWCIYVYYYYY
jgi:hypothetical protein